MGEDRHDDHSNEHDNGDEDTEEHEPHGFLPILHGSMLSLNICCESLSERRAKLPLTYCLLNTCCLPRCFTRGLTCVGGSRMGRGRQKAKHTKVARELKYFSPNTDLSQLERELGVAKRTHTEDDVWAEYADKYNDYDEDEEEEEETL